MCGYLNEDSSAVPPAHRGDAPSLPDGALRPAHLREGSRARRSHAPHRAGRRGLDPPHLARYLARHAYGAVETADLRRACEEETGRNLSWFFDQWVHHGGHPELRVRAPLGRATRSLVLTIEQVQEEDGGLTPVYRLPLTLEVVAGGRRLRLPLDLRERKETVHVRCRPARYVALDPEHHWMKLLEFPRTDEELAIGLARSPT